MAKLYSFTTDLLLLTIFICNFAHYSHSTQCKTRPPIIFNLGDSNSDTGGLVAGLGYRVNLPNGRAFFGKPVGRFSDGRLIIDFLCQSLKTSLLDPYLNSLGSTFSNGANFAIAGSTTLPRYVPFALNIQVQQFTHFKERTSELGNLIDYDGFRHALYTIDIGQNDIADSFSNGLTYSQVLEKIPSILEEIKNAIKEIYNQDGRNFWVHNTGPLGCLPQKLALIKPNTSNDLDSFGCISNYNGAAEVFNKGLFDLCQTLSTEMKDAKVVYVDIYAIKLDLIANSTYYGFSTPMMACCGSGGPPYNYDKRVSTCGSQSDQVCGQDSKFVSWDGIHYTEAANAFVASKILSTNYSTPQVMFDFFCS